jgi:tetratricopeptide (TPR) repeat protein
VVLPCNRLRALRGEQSQEEFVQRIGISSRIWQEYENGKLPAAHPLARGVTSHVTQLNGPDAWNHLHALLELLRAQDPTFRLRSLSVREAQEWDRLRHGGGDKPDLYGRDGEVSGLLDAARKRGLIGLHGPPGVGKTALARRVAWELAGHQVVRWVDLADCHSIEAAHGAIAAALDALPGQNARAKLGSLLGRLGRVLLVLDQTDDLPALLDDATAWAALAPEATVLVIRQHVAPSLHGIRLRPLHPADALRLLAVVSPGPWDAESLRPVLADLDHLPLAITEVAPWIRAIDPTRILGHLPEVRGQAILEEGTLAWRVNASLSRLSPGELGVLAGAWIFTSWFRVSAVAAVLDAGEPSITRALTGLVDRSLVEEGNDGTFRLLRVVRADLERRATTEEADRLRTRAAAWFARHGEPRALAAVESGADPATSLLEELDDVVLASGRVGPFRGRLARAARLGLEFRGEIRDALRVVVDAEPHVNRSERPALLCDIGRSARLLGDLTQAEAAYLRVLEAPTAVEEDRFQALLGLGAVAATGGNSHQARRYAREARALRAGRGLDHRARLAVLEGNLALREGQLDEAEACMREGLTAADAAGDLRLSGLIAANLAVLLDERGDSGSVAMAKRALEVAEQRGDRTAEAIARMNMTGYQAKEGDVDGARTAARLGAERARIAGDLQTEGRFLTQLGALERLVGRRMEAAALLAEGLRLASACGDHQFVELATGNRAALARVAGNWSAAWEGYERALEAAPPMGGLRARWMVGKAWVRLGEGDTHSAETLADLAAASAVSASDRLHVEIARAAIAWAQERTEDAVRILDEAPVLGGRDDISALRLALKLRIRPDETVGRAFRESPYCRSGTEPARIVEGQYDGGRRSNPSDRPPG